VSCVRSWGGVAHELAAEELGQPADETGRHGRHRDDARPAARPAAGKPTASTAEVSVASESVAWNHG
jgi:hypothetical protein